MKKKIYDDDMLTAPMIIGQISRMHRSYMRENEVAAPIMGQNSCRMILMRLSFGDGLTQLELSQETKLKPPTVSVALKRMETEGYVYRESDPDDLRITRVWLTEKGKALDQSTEERFRIAEEKMMQGFTAEESRLLCRMLLRIRNNLAGGEYRREDK